MNLCLSQLTPPTVNRPDGSIVYATQKVILRSACGTRILSGPYGARPLSRTVYFMRGIKIGDSFLRKRPWILLDLY
jgi:hypothetical protein